MKYDYDMRGYIQLVYYRRPLVGCDWWSQNLEPVVGVE